MMRFFYLLQADSAAPAAGGNWSFLIMMVAIFAVMWFLMIRPQQKKQKEMQNMRNNLKKGDKVITLGGIYGIVYDVKETYFIIEIDNNVKIKVDKSSINKDMTDVPAK